MPGQAVEHRDGAADRPESGKPKGSGYFINGIELPALTFPPKEEEKKAERPDYTVDEGKPSPRDEVDWVYHHRLDEKLPNHAPSHGAMAMLVWARENSEQFYRMWTSTFLSKPTETDAAETKQRKRTNRDLKKRLREIIG